MLHVSDSHWQTYSYMYTFKKCTGVMVDSSRNPLEARTIDILIIIIFMIMIIIFFLFFLGNYEF